MTTVLSIINPVFGKFVTWHWLNVLEALPFFINGGVRCVVFNSIDKPQSYGCSQFLLWINYPFGSEWESPFYLLLVCMFLHVQEVYLSNDHQSPDQEHAMANIALSFWKTTGHKHNITNCQNPGRNAKAAIYCHYFACVENCLYHVQHEPRSFIMLLKLCWVSWIIVAVNWAVLPFLQINQPHPQLPLITIFSRIIFIATWVWPP